METTPTTPAPLTADAVAAVALQAEVAALSDALVAWLVEVATSDAPG